MVVFCITGHKMHKVRTELYVEIHFVLNYRIVKISQTAKVLIGF